jgi:chorismate lyase
MSAAWRLFLFGNGSPTHHLGLLSGSPTEVDVIGHAAIGAAHDGAQKDHIAAIPAPRVRRQVWLRNTRGERLGYAASWLNEDDVGKVFKNQRIPIGKNILQNRTELFRDMKSVFCGTSRELEEAFGFAGPFWGRSYLFWKGGRPVTFIYEVFSPALEKYMGPVLVTEK